MRKHVLTGCPGSFKLFVALAFSMAVPTVAQTVTIGGRLDGVVPEGMKFYIMQAGVRNAAPDSLVLGNGGYSATCRASEFRFYNIVSVYNQRQHIVPIVVADGVASHDLPLVVDSVGARLAAPNDDDRALGTFYGRYAQLSKGFWMEGKKMDDGQLRSFPWGYMQLADSVVGAIRPSEATGEYIRLWAATLVYETLGGMKYASGRSLSDVGMDRRAEAVKLLPTVDHPMSQVFYGATSIALAALTQKRLEGQFEELETKVKDDGLRRRARQSLLRQWLSGFDYNKNFDTGLERLRDLTAKYGIDKSFLADFEAKRYAIVGRPFPKEARLLDINGKEVGFDTFRGKYVYIDVWASWCAPCIKEIPYIKQLEQELAGRITFVSISADSNVEAWKRKSGQLDLHGNQLLSSDGQLMRSLNIASIPRFLLYDPSGNLYNIDAPRPSDPKTKPLLESLGKSN